MSDAEVLDAFRSLFRGRSEIWGSVEGRSNQEPVTEKHYQLHLEGKRSLGVYPLLDDGYCHFAAADLDEKDFEKAVKVRNGLKDIGIAADIAESKSKGYHVYVFAETRFLAKDIRWVLHSTLQKINISAEIFPKQDKLDEVIKFGNYINLPYFGMNSRQFLTMNNVKLSLETALSRIVRVPEVAVGEAVANLPQELPQMVPLKIPKLRSRKAASHPPCILGVLKGVNQGMRDTAAFALARHYLDQQFTPDEVTALLVGWDRKNNPPINDQKLLETKVRSAEKGYAFGCTSIRGDDLLSGFCPGEDKCDWLREQRKKKGREKQQESQNSEEEHRQLLTLARPLLDDPGVLHKAIHTVEDLGVVGERRNIGLLHLLARSRALARPVNIEVNSPSSAGKTHTVTGTLTLEDSEAYYEITASSERALIYLEEPLSHRILYIQEPEGLAQGVGFAAIKSLVWEGRLKYDTVVKEEGEFVGKHIEKDGPTGLIVTTTTSLQEQLSNRLLRLEVDASSEQTRRVLGVIASRVNGAKPNIDLTLWHAFSRLLGSPVDVEIPFSHYLAERISTLALRIRRDFTHLLTLIQASAVEYQYQRARTTDGRIIATVADYAHVYSLVRDAFQAAQEEGITKADRKMIAAAEYLTTPDGGKPGEKPVTQAAIRSHLGMSKSQVSYRVNRLVGLGYLANLEQLKGRPQKIVPGVPLPEEVPPLPSPCRVAEWLVETGRSDLVMPWVDPVDGTLHNCADHIPLISHKMSASLGNRTPEPCPRCLNSEAKSEGSGTNRTPEPLSAKESSSSAVRSEAEPQPPSYGPEADDLGSSGVRFKEKGNDDGESILGMNSGEVLDIWRKPPTGVTKMTPWGIPIPDEWDDRDPVFQRQPLECGCFRDGILRCGEPCVWAWPPGAKIGDRSPSISRRQ